MNIQNREIKTYFLQRWGLTSGEMERLRNVRRKAILQELFLTQEEYLRLAFVRWLVMTGRITEQIK